MNDWMCNTGGPMSRRRTARLQSSLLGNADGFVRCPSRRKAGFVFADDADPVTLVTELCLRCGFANGEAARRALRHRLPPASLVAMPYEGSLPEWPRLMCEAGEDVLVEALVLGLCTACYYDPNRPVLWTRTGLLRRLELFSAEEFYAA